MMPVTLEQQTLLKQLPAVDRLIAAAQQDLRLHDLPKTLLTRAIREILETERRRILQSPPQPPVHPEDLSAQSLLRRVAQRAADLQAYTLQTVINATGIVVHTNLGRSCLAPAAVDHVSTIARSYSNLEFDLSRGRRGSRYSAVEDLLCELSGAEAALAVNNNAAAVLLCLDTLAHGREVVISRGELVEIGGSFRIPDVMSKSGAVLKEIGTTNRTHLRDYENAIGSNTGLLLKVHTSNYAIVGFTAAVGLTELAALGAKFNLPVMEDLGSGNLIDLSRYGLAVEPTVQHSVDSGADVVTFSGDKLLGGPQAGLIVGKKEIIDRIKSNPLTRALRIDKLTLAALEATLRLYRDEPRALEQIPTLRMLTIARPEIERRARQLAAVLEALSDERLHVTLCDLPSQAGGGALPTLMLPSYGVSIRIRGLSVNGVESALRGQRPAIIGRIENDLFLMDARTLLDEELPIISAAFQRLLNPPDSGETHVQNPI
jgi:L-seryl-tRNA(Ser) seleniumtransferase